MKFYSFSHPRWPFIGFYGGNVVCLQHSCRRDCHWKVGPHGRCWAIGVGNGSMPLSGGETGSTLTGICPHSQTVLQARMFSRPHRLNAFDLRCFLPRLGYWARTTQCGMAAYSTPTVSKEINPSALIWVAMSSCLLSLSSTVISFSFTSFVFEARSHYIAQAHFKLTILPPWLC